MELTTGIIFLFLSSVNNDLFIYVFIYLFICLFVIDMGCEIKYEGTTESSNIQYISIQLICATAITSYHQKMF